MRFSDIPGHKELKERLTRGADSGRIPHAQLFTGASGYGTLPLAVAYATYVNCTDRRDGDSCGVCASCRKMDVLEHPDLHFVFPVATVKVSSNRKAGSDVFIAQWREIFRETGGFFDEQQWYRAISIENQQGMISKQEADEVIRKLSFKSFEARYKTMVIWLPEKMRVEAANALLKILEEPWDRTLFLMVSESPGKLLPTILSRTQEIPVPRIDTASLTQALAAGFPGRGGKTAAVAKTAAGDLVNARRIMEGDEADTGEFFSLFVALMRLSYNDRHMELLDWGDSVASLGREQQKKFLQYSIGMLRENFMMNAGMHNITHLWGDELDFSTKFSPFIGNHNIEQLVAEMETAISQVSQNGNARIIFPHFALAVSKLIVKR